LYEPTNAWLVMKQIKVEEAVQEPILALRMAGRVFPVAAEMASSLIVTFRKVVVFDGKRDGMLVEVELSFARGRNRPRR
jgi:hypothetical protein